MDHDEVFCINGEDFTIESLLERVVQIHAPSDSDMDELAAYLEGLVEQAVEVSKAEVIAPSEDTPGGVERLYSRRFHTFINATALGSVTVGILLGVLTHGAWWAVSATSLKKLLRFDANWRPHFVTVYLKANGAERLVLDVVHEKQTQWVITNFDAYETGQLQEAFGKVAPTLDEISAALHEKRTRKQVETTVEGLVERGVLALTAHRYSIPF